MVRLLFFLVLFILHCQAAQASVVYWDGGGGNDQWSEPLNWDTDRVPDSTDEVVLDHNVIEDAYEVMLPAGDVAVVVERLSILPGTGPGITLTLPFLNTSLMGLRVKAAGDAIVLASGSVLVNASGADQSSTPLAVSGAGLIRINNGATYIHRTARSATENLVSRLSVAPGTETGLFLFDVPVASYIISASGRSFGSLGFAATAYGSPVTYRCSGGSELLIRGSLLLFTSASLACGLSADIRVEGHLVQELASVLNLQTSSHSNRLHLKGDLSSNGLITESGTGAPVLELEGSALQRIGVQEAPANEVTLLLRNDAGFQLTRSLNIDHRIQFASGIVHGSDEFVLQLNQPAEVLGGSPTSFMDGPVYKTGPGDLVLPTGMGQIYAPLRIDASSAQPGDGLRVLYVRSNPQTSVGNVLGGAPGEIDHVSQVEYWSIAQTGNFAARVAISVTEQSFCSTLAGSFIAGFRDGTWLKSESLVSAGPEPAGAFQTGELIETEPHVPALFYTIATAAPVSGNPLPVRAVDLRSVITRVDNTELVWWVDESPATGDVFLIEHAGETDSFSLIHRMNATPARMQYRYLHPLSPDRFNRFRVCLLRSNGERICSRILHNTITRAPGMLLLKKVYPSPADNWIHLTVESLRSGRATMRVYNAAGILMLQQEYKIWSGDTIVDVPVHRLPAGLYLVETVMGSGRSNALRFVKR